MNALDDPRLARGSDLALDAEVLERLGEPQAAARKFAEAADLYEAVAIAAKTAKCRGVLAVSSVVLAAKAGRLDEAVAKADRFIGSASQLGPSVEAVRMLRESYAAQAAESKPA